MSFANKNEILRELCYLRAFGYRFISPNFGIEAVSKSAKNMLELENQISSCNLCELCKSRNHALIGSGDLGSKIMFITQMPSASEDMSGRYLDGVVGEKFCQIVAEILGIRKDEFYITSLIKCKTHSNLAPNSVNYELCKPYLLSQIDIISPKVIVALGEAVFLNLINQANSFESVRGSVFRFKNSNLIPTYSLAWVLKNPSKERDFIDDLRKIKGLL